MGAKMCCQLISKATRNIMRCLKNKMTKIRTQLLKPF
jgi:hypothetical protein